MQAICDRCTGVCRISYTSNPVRYFNGQAKLERTDVSSSAFGTPWSHTRTYSNQMPSNFNRGNGWNWNPAEWSYLAATNVSGASLALYSNLSHPRYFSRDPATDLYTPMFGDLCTFVHDAAGQKFVLTEQDGTVVVFHDFLTSVRPGEFLSRTVPGGNVISVVQETSTQILEVQQTQDSTTESFLYQYAAGNLTSCSQRRRTGTGLWQSVTRALYTYYDGTDSNGNADDLRTVTLQIWQTGGASSSSSSSGSSGSWGDVSTEYYRYYTSNQASGFKHGLRYVCLPQAFSDLSASVGDPFTASDAEVSLFADYYYEYDDSDRVVLEQVKGGSQTFSLEFEPNPHYSGGSGSSSASDLDLGFNVWFNKTTETRPDGTQNTVYCNQFGQPMLTVLQSGPGTPSSSSSGSSSGGVGEWCNFYRYDDSGRPILQASPSAVLGYNEGYDDLLGYNPTTGKFLYLRNTEGLLQLTNYYTSSDAPQPEGYLKNNQIQQGQNGTPILLSSTEYTSVTDGTTTIYPVSVQTQYPDAANPSIKIQASYSYTYYPGTLQVQQQTTTLPVISTSQNGSGVANTTKAYFDQLGNQLWSMNERGYITGITYDLVTGAVIQQIADYDTSQVGNSAPSGWTTPAGGGLNLITNMTIDSQGRTIQTLGPSHAIDLAGTATVIRTANWTVYDEVNHITYSGQGYATGTDPAYSDTLVNPVSITKMGPGGRVNEQIQAVAPSTVGSLADIISSAGGGAIAFPQTSYTRWTTAQYTDCCLAASQRVYHTIPSSGSGVSGTNYDETDYGYDSMKRLYRTVSPGGTISEQVFDARGLVASSWIGTNDDGGTFSDPSGGGTNPNNNMVCVTANEYDNGLSGGDGNLTAQTQFVDSTTSRVTTMTYDFRNRQVDTDGEVDYFAVQYYDNLNRVVRRERYDTSAAGHLIARSDTKYDDLGRVYQSIQYGVDPNTGTVGNSLISNTWYDQSGNTIKSLPAGASLFTKTTFDSLGRAVVQYQGYDLDETSYADAFTVTNDVILQQSETTYDDASNVIQSTVRLRYHNAPDTQTGTLQNPSANPKARVVYGAAWQDGIGRPVVSANYGTNGGTALSRPSTAPAGSDTVLVTLTTFDAAGNVLQSTDPAGMVTQFEYDDAGRRITQIDNYQSSSSSSSSGSSSGSGCSPSADTNRTTQFTYTPDGQQATLTALNSQTGNQTTTWTYGTTLADSGLASSQLLRSVIYPDSTSGSDVVLYSYNIQGQQATLTDQRGCVHTFDYDLLGRPVHDRVTTAGTGVDTAVLRLSTTYEVRGLPATLTSYDNATVGSGSIVNQVQFAYNTFAQVVADYQEHSGAVNTSTTPQVQYSYANGSTNTIRPTAVTYPNGRVLSYSYGTTGGINDAIGRVGSLIDDDGTTHLVDYSYLGLGTTAIADDTEPDVQYTLVDLSGTNDPDTGDIYSGLDRFGRVKDCRWYNYGSSTDVARLQYGYDRASDRLWRADPVAQSLGQQFDELYAYDGLHRLQNMQRGQLTSGHASVSSENFGQCWTLDSTSNWAGFQEAATGGAATLVQARTATPVNEINDITNTVGTPWATPGYDPAGNMTTIPSPSSDALSWATLTTNQWATLTKEEWAGLPVAPQYAATYDAWNRLMTVADPASGNFVQANQYDPRTFRVVRETYAAGTLAETRQFYYTPSWQALEERLGTSPATSAPERQQVWGLRYIDDLVLRDRDTNGDGTLDERLYGLQDANWNVVALIDTSAVAQERYLYAPFGSPTFLTGNMATVLPESALLSDVLLTGQRFEPATQLYLFRMRYLNSNTGTFLSKDPIGYPNGPNAYAAWFVQRFTDPLGTSAAEQLPWTEPFRLRVFNPVPEPVPQVLPGLGASAATAATAAIGIVLLNPVPIANSECRPDPERARKCYCYTSYQQVHHTIYNLLEGGWGDNASSTGYYRSHIQAAEAELANPALHWANIGYAVNPNTGLPRSHLKEVRNWCNRLYRELEELRICMGACREAQRWGRGRVIYTTQQRDTAMERVGETYVARCKKLVWNPQRPMNLLESPL